MLTLAYSRRYSSADRRCLFPDKGCWQSHWDTTHRSGEAGLSKEQKNRPGCAARRTVREVYRTDLANYVYFRVGSVHDAEDLTARVFLKALNNLSCYRFVVCLFPLGLYCIAHNLIANHHRDQSRRREF